MSHPIRTAILSYGMSGHVFHGPLLQAHSGFDFAAVLERSKDKARSHYPDVQVVRTAEAIFNDDSIELVIVNTPHDTHYELTKRALEAGKHVVVEKPFTTTVGEGEELMRLAKARELMLSVFHNRRWDGDFMTVKKIIDSQTLGRLVEVESHYDRYRPQVDSGTWKETKEKGAGILYNLGSHIIDQALCLFGMPQAVQALVGIQRTGGIADDYYDIKLLYAQHHVILKSSYLVRELGPRYVLLGEKGTFVKYGIDPQEQLLKDGIMPGVAGWGMDEEHLWGTLNTTLDGLHIQGAVETMAGNYSGFYDSVYNHIRGGQPLAVSAQDGLAVIAVIELAEQSSRERRTVSLS